MKTYCLFHHKGVGFNGRVRVPIKDIISHMKDGMCLWVDGDFYMEVDCPDSKRMNARFENGSDRINKEFSYSYDGFIQACAWFDKLRCEYGHKITDS